MVRFLQRTYNCLPGDLVLQKCSGGNKPPLMPVRCGRRSSLQKKSRTPKAQIMLETLLIVAASGVGSLALIVRELRQAPEGYEDEHGFHIGICAY